MSRYGHAVDLSGIGAVAAAIVALGALIVALLARRDSRQSAVASAAAARAAEAALALQEAEVARAREVSDVAWALRVPEAGTIACVNTGGSAAHNVRLVLTIDKHRETLVAGTVAPGDSLDFTRATDIWRIAPLRNGSPELVAIAGPRENAFRVKVTARVAWTSQLGTPSTQVM